LSATPFALSHSWPLFEQGQRFDLGFAHDSESWPAVEFPFDERPFARPDVGLWQCELADDRLTWSDEVYDIFGLPRGAFISRTETVALYCEESRATMERLRAYAIKHRRGFTLDAQIVPAVGNRRWMRLMAAPICEERRVVRLHGLKRDVSSEYI
jgi:PAS domain-containing protein